MALADKALWGYDSIEELLKPKIPAREEVLPLCGDDPALTRRIVRKCTKAGGISDEPMPESAFTQIASLTSLKWRTQLTSGHARVGEMGGPAS